MNEHEIKIKIAVTFSIILCMSVFATLIYLKHKREKVRKLAFENRIGVIAEKTGFGKLTSKQLKTVIMVLGVVVVGALVIHLIRKRRR